MTPEQIQELARLLAAQVSAPPWWSYPLMLVFAAVGTFVGAVLKRRGENYATTADFETLKMQLVANTHATEEVKAALAGRSWMKQQLWAQREKYYMELLGQLSEVGRCAKSLFELELREMRVGGPLPPHLQERAQECESGMAAAEKELRRGLAPASVFLSRATGQTVSELLGSRETLMSNSPTPFDFFDEWSAEAWNAYRKVLAEAQRELRDGFEDSQTSISER